MQILGKSKWAKTIISLLTARRGVALHPPKKPIFDKVSFFILGKPKPFFKGNSEMNFTEILIPWFGLKPFLTANQVQEY